MQKRALFLHKQIKSTPIFPLHIHKSRTIYVAKSAFRDINLPQCPQVRWPSDFCWIAIRLTPKWPSVSRPIAIHHSSDGHRTGVNTPLPFSPLSKPSFLTYYRRVDSSFFKSLKVQICLSFKYLQRKNAIKIANFQARFSSLRNTRFSREKYTV